MHTSAMNALSSGELNDPLVVSSIINNQQPEEKTVDGIEEEQDKTINKMKTGSITTSSSSRNPKRGHPQSHIVYRRKYHVRALCQTVAFVCLVVGFCIYNGAQSLGLFGDRNTSSNGSNNSLSRSAVTPVLETTTATATTVSDFPLEDWESRILHDLEPDDAAELEKYNATIVPDHTQTSTTANEIEAAEAEADAAEAKQECEDKKADPAWMIIFHSIGVIYMFLALAIVCDEFFVPALEEMSTPRRLNLSMDVAGATLMAAGGSAPELFTSLFGTFQESEVGFGTIVGSAVFNVLFVIAMCSLMSKEVLSLTWWPLFRDSTYYAIGLSTLTVFVGVTTPNEIVLWESMVLFALYLGYILLMWQNANLYKAITGKELEYPDDDGDGDDDKAHASNGDAVEESKEGETERPKMDKRLSAGQIDANMKTDGVSHFRWQGTFRAGILKLLRDPESWIETAGVGIVAKIAGDADYVFRQIDSDGNGNIDKSELKKLFEVLDCNLTEDELDNVFKELDENGDGQVRKKKVMHATFCYFFPTKFDIRNVSACW